MRSEDIPQSPWPDEGPTVPLDSLERRASGRIALEVDVTLNSDSQFFAGLSGDVSEGGLFVHTYKRYEVGTRILVAFSLPTASIQTPGTVRWVRPAAGDAPPGVGIAFEALSSGDRESIEAFCRARPPLYHDVDGA
jgi:uncharacterized protein (TIGR02266 family)